MRRIGYVFSAAGQGFWRNPVMSLASTFTVTLMLLLFSFFLTTDRGLQAAVGVLESKVEIATFLDDNAKVSEILALKARIEADLAVSRVEYVTKDQALQRLRDIADRRKDFIIADVDANLLPASLEIKLADARQAKRVGDDLRAEIDKAKQRPGGRIEPLPEVRPYVSHEYQMADRRSPFLQSLAGENPTGPRPDVQRPREYLEQFPLDTLKMVGTLRLGGGNFGLVQTKDGLIHRVLPGNHLGQNDGRVMAVSDAKITVVEIVPDGLGGYLERPAALALAD